MSGQPSGPVVLSWSLGLVAAASVLAVLWLPAWYVAVPAALLCLAFAGFAAGRCAAPMTGLADAVRRFCRDGKAASLADPAIPDALLEPLRLKLQALAYDSTYLAGAMRSSSDALAVCAPDGTVLFISRKLCEMAGVAVTQAQDIRFDRIFSGPAGEAPAQVAQSRSNVEQEFQFRTAAGQERSLRLAASPIFGTDGGIVGVNCLVIDRTERAQQQKTLEEQRNRMAEVGSEMNELAQRVASASEELSAAADEQARGALKQKDRTDVVARSVEDMAATVLEVAQNATATSQAASDARAVAGDGVGMVRQAVTGINAVAQSTDRLSAVLVQLNGQAGQIGKVINVINEIADQTNLLALNAAIEAARAGEAGRGFAVVADEVRKLAEKTMAATKEVEEAIRTIQQGSEHATNSMLETAGQMKESTELSNRAGESLATIMEHIENMVTRVAQIAAAAEKQSASAENISRSVEDIAMVAREAEEGASQTAAATRDLAELAQELLTVSMRFSESEPKAKLRKSSGEMKGILPKLAQDFVQTAYPKAFAAMNEEMGRPVFLPTAGYPDQVLTQMAECVARLAGISVRDFFLSLGRFTIVQFHRMYRRYFKDEDLKSFYMRMNEVHAQLTRDQPGIHPPNFTYEDKGSTLFMNYRSGRGLFDYFEGILHGAAEFMKQKVRIKVIPLDKETARAEITFL